MTEIESNLENNTKDIKLYSSKSISGATFLGGPLAAGYLISENFKALDNPSLARKSLLIAIIATIIILGGLMILPDKFGDHIPNQLIPFIYTGIIWGIVEWKQGDILKAHLENNNSFFSGWRAAAVGLIAMLIIGVGIFGYAFLATNNQTNEQYDIEFAQFSKNEIETLTFYDHLNSGTNYTLVQELDHKVLPKWKENIEIINRTNAIKDLPSELIKKNEILLKYSKLRIQAFELFRKAIIENTDKYALQLEQIHNQIDKELAKIN